MSNLCQGMPEDLDSRFYLVWCINNEMHPCKYESLKQYIDYLSMKGGK